MKCPKCGRDEAYLVTYDFIDGNSKIGTNFFYVALVLLECPCGYKRFDQLHFRIPFFPQTEFILTRQGIGLIELFGRLML